LVLVTAADAAYAQGASSQSQPCTKAPTQADLDAAKGLHQAAKQYLAKALYERAIQSWLDAAAFDCTKPEVFINIGGTYERMGDTNKAIASYQTYLDRKGAAADPDTVEKVKNLKALAAKNRQKAENDAASNSSNQASGSSEVPPPPEQPETGAGPGAWPWVLAGTGGAIAVTGAILLGVGASKISSAEALCPDRNCGAAPAGTPPEDLRAAQEKGNSGLTFERVGGTMVGVGLAAAGGGLLWHFLSAPTKTESAVDPTAPPSAKWNVTPAVGWGYYGVSSKLTF
jgi:hypothetical protein